VRADKRKIPARRQQIAAHRTRDAKQVLNSDR
jgi:hypothetical protein